MSEDKNVYAIAVEVSTALQRDQIQAFVKAEADSWWHGLADLWLVTGKSAQEWRDSLRAFFPTSGTGNLLVFKVDTEQSEYFWRSWTFSESQRQWLKENLASKHEGLEG